MRAVTARWKPADQPRARGQLSCSKNISAFCAIFFQRLSNDTYVGDARLLDRVHDRRESAERDVFVGTDKNELVVRITNFLPQFGGDLVDIHGVIAEEDALILINSDDRAFFCDLLDGAGLGNGHFDARLKNGSGHHKDDQEYQDNVNERSDVDVRESSLGAAVGRSKGHQRLTSAAAWGWTLSMAFSTSREKSSPRAAKTRMELPIKL